MAESTECGTAEPSVPFLVLPCPEIGIVKAQSAAAQPTADGFVIPFEILVRNDGGSRLTQLELLDDVEAQLGSALVSVSPLSIDPFQTTAVSPPGVGVLPNLFDGTGQLDPAEEVLVRFDATVAGSAASLRPLSNQAEARAVGPTGNLR